MRFTEDDGTVAIIGTYTAFAAREARSELLRGIDFRGLRDARADRRRRRNKGMALFPREIGGQYADARAAGQREPLAAPLGRLCTGTAGKSVAPHYPWEFVQIGNCGSPIEIDEGWLLLHPRRRHGAQLLHRRVPARQGRPVEGAGAHARRRS